MLARQQMALGLTPATIIAPFAFFVANLAFNEHGKDVHASQFVDNAAPGYAISDSYNSPNVMLCGDDTPPQSATELYRVQNRHQ